MSGWRQTGSSVRLRRHYWHVGTRGDLTVVARADRDRTTARVEVGVRVHETLSAGDAGRKRDNVMSTTTNPFADPANVPDIFGGVQLVAVMDDTELLCEKCVTDPSNPVHDERGNADPPRDGWGVIAFDTTQSIDEPADCSHCGATIVAAA